VHETETDRAPNLAQPWAPHRRHIYLGVAAWTSLVFVAMTVGVGVGLIEPTFTSDVIANVLFGVPVMVLPLVILWDAPGENRSRLEKAAELTLFSSATRWAGGHRPRIPVSSGCGGSTDWPTPVTPAVTRGRSGSRSSASSPE
jgi:hypothetical protein